MTDIIFFQEIYQLGAEGKEFPFNHRDRHMNDWLYVS